MYSCVWVPVHWQWRPLSLEVPCFPKHLLAPSHRGPSDLVRLSEGRRKRVNRYFVAAQREANATKLCTWHSSTAFLSARVCVWPGSRMPVEMHSRTLRIASPGLSGPVALLITFSTSSSIAWKKKQSNGRRHHMSRVYCRTACPLNTSLGHLKLSPPTQSNRVWPSYECSACFS